MASVIELLALAGGLGTTGALVAVVVLAFKLVRAKDDVIAAGDQIDKWRGEATTVQNQLAVEEQAHEATTKRFNEERELRAIAESERNDAVRAEREATVALIKETNVEGANAIIARLLARRIGVLPEAGAVPDLSDPADRLLKPGDV